MKATDTEILAEAKLIAYPYRKDSNLNHALKDHAINVHPAIASARKPAQKTNLHITEHQTSIKLAKTQKERWTQLETITVADFSNIDTVNKG